MSKTYQCSLCGETVSKFFNHYCKENEPMTTLNQTSTSYNSITVGDETSTWTKIAPSKSFTLDEMRELVSDLTAEIQRRGYFTPYVSITIRDDNNNTMLSLGGSCAHPDRDYDSSIYFSAPARTGRLDELIAKTNLMLEEKLPDTHERLKREFNKTLETMTTLADKLGENIPEFNVFAAALRESVRSNLLEHTKKGVK